MCLIITIQLFSDSTDMDKLFESKKNKFDKTKSQKVENYDNELMLKNREFSKQLEESWATFEAKIEELGIGPKPRELPVIEKPTDLPQDDPSIVIIEDKPDIPVEPVIKEPISPPTDGTFIDTSITFFGDKLTFKHSRDIKKINIDKLSDKSISKKWKEYSNTNFSPLITQLESRIEYYELNPWGMYKLVNSLGKRIHKTNKDRVLFNAFIMSQLGQNCKISYSKNRAYLLFPSKKPLYGKVYLNIDGVKYYIIENTKGSLKQIKTYKATFPGALKEFDLTVEELPKLKESSKKKTLNFTYKGELNKVSVEYNATLVEFFEDYPQTHYENYFESELFYKTKIDITEGLKPLLLNKSETEAVNIILHFVQKSFDYKTDQEQFNREKPLFPEETIHYQYSDCEDRSVLFTYLVREILGLKVVGLKYPGHMATAVLLKKPVGDTVQYNGKEFTIADPTYINANIGVSMPDFKEVKPDVIGVN